MAPGKLRINYGSSLWELRIIFGRTIDSGTGAVVVDSISLHWPLLGDRHDIRWSSRYMSSDVVQRIVLPLLFDPVDRLPVSCHGWLPQFSMQNVDDHVEEDDERESRDSLDRVASMSHVCPHTDPLISQGSGGGVRASVLV